ncbi:MAG: S26 family signal peptidase [Mycobacteriales bacterium]
MILLGRLRVALVSGPSMAPALRDGDRVVVWMGTPERSPVGRIVLVDLPDRPLSVKRLVGVNHDGSVLIEGDNEFASTDSRTLGPQPANAVRGRVLGRLWPRPRLL